MKQKSSFLIYHEYREPLKLLTDEQRGRLLMALIDYSESGVVPELDGISMMAFSFIQSQMDPDLLYFILSRKSDFHLYKARWIVIQRSTKIDAVLIGKMGRKPKKPIGF